MKALIAERPNMNPVGLGHNNTTVDASVLLPTTEGVGDDKGNDSDADSCGSEDEDEDEDEDGRPRGAVDYDPARADPDQNSKQTHTGRSPSEDLTSNGHEYFQNSHPSENESSELDDNLFDDDGRVNLSMKRGGRVKAPPSKLPSTPAPAGRKAVSSAKQPSEAKTARTEKTEKGKDKERPAKKIRLEDKFVLAHAEEEKTRQKAYDFKIAETDVQKIKGQLKLQKLQLRAQLQQERWRHEERMAEFAAKSSPFPAAFYGGHGFPHGFPPTMMHGPFPVHGAPSPAPSSFNPYEAVSSHGSFAAAAGPSRLQAAHAIVDEHIDPHLLREPEPEKGFETAHRRTMLNWNFCPVCPTCYCHVTLSRSFARRVLSRRHPHRRTRLSAHSPLHLRPSPRAAPPSLQRLSPTAQTFTVLCEDPHELMHGLFRKVALAGPVCLVDEEHLPERALEQLLLLRACLSDILSPEVPEVRRSAFDDFRGRQEAHTVVDLAHFARGRRLSGSY